jgi:uncharacterized membrane protein YhaH (DUF805 family)
MSDAVHGVAVVFGMVLAVLIDTVLSQGVAFSVLAGALAQIAIILTTLSALALLAYGLGVGCRRLIDYGERRP